MATGKSEFVFEGLSGLARQMLYATAMTTGFRAKELRSLVPTSFDVESPRPLVTVKAGYSKNRHESTQPLPGDIAEALRGYLAGKPSNQPVWPGDWFVDAAEMLRYDLEAAGIPYRDAEGQVFDFHGLRGAYCTLLAQSGVHPKLAQELARHSDIRMTMNLYTHTRLHDLAGAVDGLPALLNAAPLQQLKATGTDPRLTPACAIPDLQRDRVRLAGTGEPDRPAHDTGRNPLILQGIEASGNSVGLSETELPRLDSNQDKESQNLLCYRYTTG